MEELFYKIIDIMFHILPVNKKWVMYTSFWGRYNDNPKYISKYMHQSYPEFKQFWGISRKCVEKDIPDYITKCKYKSIGYYWYKNRCGIIVDNMVGDYCFYQKNAANSWKTILKNKKQLNISTWHGNPIKRIGRDIQNTTLINKEDFYSTSDLLICGCKYVENVFGKCFWGISKIVLTGTPRCDAMFNGSVEIEKIKNKLHLPTDKKIVLYAPTYRNNPEDSGIAQISNLDINLLLSSLSKRFGGEWVFVFRVHNSVISVIKKISDSISIFDGNLGEDMMEYLQVVDVLITDYSGSIFDFAHTYKPCFLYAHDRIQYENIERGIYMNISDLPYIFCETSKDLYQAIEHYDEIFNKEKVDRFNEKIGNFEDGKASERVIDYMVSRLA